MLEEGFYAPCFIGMGTVLADCFKDIVNSLQAGLMGITKAGPGL